MLQCMDAIIEFLRKLLRVISSHYFLLSKCRFEENVVNMPSKCRKGFILKDSRTFSFMFVKKRLTVYQHFSCHI